MNGTISSQFRLFHFLFPCCQRRSFYGCKKVGTYDPDGSGDIDKVEYDAALHETREKMTFDTACEEDGDSYLNESEYSITTGDSADCDADNRLNQNEFNSFFDR